MEGGTHEGMMCVNMVSCVLHSYDFVSRSMLVNRMHLSKEVSCPAAPAHSLSQLNQPPAPTQII